MIKKNLIKFVMWDRLLQAGLGVALILALLEFAMGDRLSSIVAFCVGLNVSGLFYYEFYIRSNRSAKYWRNCFYEARRMQYEGRDVNEALSKLAIEARRRSAHIDPLKN